MYFNVPSAQRRRDLKANEAGADDDRRLRHLGPFDEGAAIFQGAQVMNVRAIGAGNI